MTSFGATKVLQENFMPTFKIQGQIYHHIGYIHSQDRTTSVGSASFI